MSSEEKSNASEADEVEEVVVAKDSSMEESPAKEAPAEEAPAEEAPAEEAPAEEAPAEEAPAKEAPAEEAPAEEAPAKEVPAKEVPAKAAPAKEVPAKAAPAKAAPAKAAPATGSENDTIRSTTYSPPVGGEKIDGKIEEEAVITEKVVTINRCAKVVKGGRRFSFSALVVAGDHAGNVGYGFGKANEVAECIRKASESAKTALFPIKMRGSTIPHETIGEFGGGKVLLRPASPGTGIIAGSSVRSVVEAAGIKDILTKSLGSNNHFNVVKATLAGLRSLRTREQIYKLRGKKVAQKKAL
jgi:small subunit ribosomal protein S5